MHLRAAADDEMIFVPVPLADERREFLLVADGADDLGFLAGADTRDLAADGVEGAATFLVVLAGVGVLPVDVGLRAGQGEGQPGDVRAVVVDAAVAAVRDSDTPP